MLKALVGERIRSLISMPASAWYVDPSQMEQVLMNLAANA